MTAQGFDVPAAVAAAVWRHVGVRAPVDRADLELALGALSARVPAGTGAKLDAVAADAVPPGADPSSCAEDVLGGRRTSWSCWPLATLAAALLRSTGWPVDVFATRRIDPKAPPVDFHAAVVIRSPDGDMLADPYHYAPPLPLGAGAVEATRPGRWSLLDAGRGRFTLTNGGPRFGVLRYRLFSEPLGPGDVDALCRVSVLHSGAPRRRQATWLRPDGYAVLRVTAGGAVALDRWRAAPAGATWTGAWRRTWCHTWDDGWDLAVTDRC